MKQKPELKIVKQNKKLKTSSDGKAGTLKIVKK